MFNFKSSLTLVLPPGGIRLKFFSREGGDCYIRQTIVGGEDNVVYRRGKLDMKGISRREERCSFHLVGMVMLRVSWSHILEGYKCQAKKLRLLPLRQWGTKEGF